MGGHTTHQHVTDSWTVSAGRTLDEENTIVQAPALKELERN